MRMTFANYLTICRGAASIAFIPFVIADHQLMRLFALGAFTLAAFTDYYDGKLARSQKEMTEFGILADPIADKLLTGICFVALSRYIPEIVPVWMTAVILVREIGITFYRFALVRKGRILAADRWGKWKTGLQMTVIPYALLFLALFSGPRGRAWKEASFEAGWGEAIFQFGFFLALITTLLTVGSGVHYLRRNWSGGAATVAAASARDETTAS